MRSVMYTEGWERKDLGDKKWKEAGHTDGKKVLRSSNDEKETAFELAQSFCYLWRRKARHRAIIFTLGDFLVWCWRASAVVAAASRSDWTRIRLASKGTSTRHSKSVEGQAGCYIASFSISRIYDIK